VADRVIQYLYSMKSKVIYYKGDKEGINSKRRNKGIHNKGQDNKKDGKSKVQLFIYISDALFINNSVDRKSL
jgi:hypothetical protein